MLSVFKTVFGKKTRLYFNHFLDEGHSKLSPGETV